MPVPGTTRFVDDGSPAAVRRRAAIEKLSQMPRLTSTGFPIPKQPTAEDLIQSAVEASLPAPDHRIVQAVNRAAAAANFDAKAMLADTGFLKRAAVANPADADAVAQAIIGARAENPSLQAPFITNTGAIEQIGHVLGTIEKAEPTDPHPSIAVQVMTVGQSAGFSGLDLLNTASFKDAVATIDPTDTKAVSRAIANSLASHPELRTTDDSWLDLIPGRVQQTAAPIPGRTNHPPDLEHAAQTARREDFNARMAEKAQQSIGNGPVNFQRDA